MKLEEVLPALRERKRISRLSCKEDFIFLTNNYILMLGSEIEGKEYIRVLSEGLNTTDLLAEDWEIVE